MGKQSKTALLKAARIHTYIAEESATYPEHDALDPVSMAANPDWTQLGYTSKETPMTITSEGGEITTLDTAEEDAVIAIAAAVAKSMEIKALQFDAEILDLAYNGSHDPTAKTYRTPTTSQPLTKRLLTVVTSHTGKLLGIGALSAISLGEEPALSFEALSQIGLKATVLGDNGTSIIYIGVEKSGV